LAGRGKHLGRQQSDSPSPDDEDGTPRITILAYGGRGSNCGNRRLDQRRIAQRYALRYGMQIGCWDNDLFRKASRTPISNTDLLTILASGRRAGSTGVASSTANNGVADDCHPGNHSRIATIEYGAAPLMAKNHGEGCMAGR
jgi:hypothetical protein